MSALLTATAYVLRREGWEGATTNRIAQRAGVNIGSLYQYFPNKEALVGALIDRLVERYIAGMERRMEALADASLEDALTAMISAHLDATFVDPPLQRAILTQIPRVDRLDLAMRTKRRLSELVRDLFARHTRSRIDLERAAGVVVHVVDAIYEAELFERAEPDRRRALEDAADAALAFVRHRFTERRRARAPRPG